MRRKICLAHLFIAILILPLIQGCISESAPRNRPIIDSFDFSDPGDDDTVELVKPDGQVFLQSGFCACKNAKPSILGDCATFCAGKTGTVVDQTRLYMSVELGEEITLNTELGDLKNWCNSTLAGADGTGSCANSTCKFVFSDSDGNGGELDLDAAKLVTGSKKFEVVFTPAVEFDKTYLAHLEESCNGSKSDFVQFRRISGLEDPETLAPLKIDPVNNYYCITRTASVDDTSGTIFYETGFKIHLYYVSSNEPPIIPPGTQNVFCHDIALYGANDSAMYPRLGLMPNAFGIWSSLDSRFYDIKPDPTTGAVNGKIDIHDTLDTIIKADGDSAGLNFTVFDKLNWLNFPSSLDSGSGSSTSSTQQPILGFIMAPFINPSTNKSFCPKYSDYINPSSASVIRAMKDVVGVDTEGLYLGVKQPESTTIDGTVVVAPDDYILIKGTLLKQIWFYFENQVAIAPTSVNEGTKTLHFYWPPNTASPFVQNSDQRLYTVRHPSQLASTNGSSGTFNPTLIPHDKKFACVPVSE